HRHLHSFPTRRSSDLEDCGGMGRGHSVRKRESLRVLMIAPTSFFSDYGCHVRILEEARGLQGCGHRVVICTYHHGGAVPDLTIRSEEHTSELQSLAYL